MSVVRRAGLAITALLLAAGCAAAPPPASVAPAPQPDKPPVEVAAIVVSPFSDAELAAQFEKARVLLLTDKYKEAAEAFDRLVRLSPDTEIAPPSLYNGGLAHEGLAERTVAVERYKALIERFPDHATVHGALFRMGRLHGHLEHWSELVATADRILARKDLALLEGIEARGFKALGLVEQDRVDDAAKQVRLARDIIEENHLGEAGKPPTELAQVSFALGEVRRRRSERITFSPLPPNFAEVLELRCQGLIDAQNAYTEAMRSFDAHWSAMAGYRVGQLYQQLHRDVMQIPAFKADTLRKKQLFEGAMRLRYRVLLEKGIKLMEGTVRLGERTGEDSLWVHRADEAKRDMQLALEDEKLALSKLPFTEEQIREALELLKTK